MTATLPHTINTTAASNTTTNVNVSTTNPTINPTTYTTTINASVITTNATTGSNNSATNLLLPKNPAHACSSSKHHSYCPYHHTKYPLTIHFTVSGLVFIHCRSHKISFNSFREGEMILVLLACVCMYRSMVILIALFRMNIYVLRYHSLL